MHLAETYALSCGLKIDRPYVYEHFTSIPCEKFISFNKKAYPYYLEVIKLIKPELDKRGIEIIQLRGSQENAEANITIYDNLSFGQWAYVIKHSMLHFGEDDYLFDLAGFYDIPRVIMFSTSYPNNFKPYWGSEAKQKILFSTGPNLKPSFSSDASANFVNYIKPEEIAQHIMELLGIPWTSPYTTVYAGKQYRTRHDIIEFVPDKNNPIEFNGRVSNLGVRMDFNHDEQFLASVLEKARTGIVTSKPIHMGMLHLLRKQIAEIAYIVDINSDIQFARELAKLNLPYALLAFELSVELKEKFFEVGVITPIVSPKLEDIKELKNGLNGLVYKSAKRLFLGKKEYKSNHQRIQDIPSNDEEFSPCPENPTLEFMREIEFFFIVKPNPLTEGSKS